MATITSRKYLWYSPSPRWNFYYGEHGWWICTPLFGLGWNTDNPYMLPIKKFMWEFWPTRKIIEGDFIYV